MVICNNIVPLSDSGHMNVSAMCVVRSSLAPGVVYIPESTRVYNPHAA